MQKISVTLSLVIIAYIFCNCLIFTYKDTKYLRDYQLFSLYSYPELASICNISSYTLSSLSMAKSRLYKKMFNKKGSAKDLDIFIREF